MCLYIDEPCSSKYDGLCEKKIKGASDSEVEDDDEITSNEELKTVDEDEEEIDEAVGEEVEEAEIGEHVDVPQKPPRRIIKGQSAALSFDDGKSHLLSCDFESESEDCKIRFVEIQSPYFFDILCTVIRGKFGPRIIIRRVIFSK